MNERIEKLGEQADLLGGFTPTKIPGRYVGYITEEQILKFAELIVKDTLQVAKAGIEYGPSMEDAVYTYFGIES